jgi:hypothetical protein
LTTAICPGNNPSSYNDNKVSLAELSMIHKIAERKDVFSLLIKSLCPSIYGHELVKAGLLLCMFGGTDYRLRSKGEFADFMLCRDDKNVHGGDEEMDDDKA